MKHTADTFRVRRFRRWAASAAALALCGGWFFTRCGMAAEPNLLKNPGFEETTSGADNPPFWATRGDSVGKARLADTEAHGGRNAIAIPAHTAVEQKLDAARAGAYLARCWVKSAAEQPITVLLQDPAQPWAAYTCTEIKVPRGQWVQIESFCVLSQDGSLTLTVGGMSKDFHFYHGTAGEMASPVVADDFELVRYESTPAAAVAPRAAWDATRSLDSPLDWTTQDQWTRVASPTQVVVGTPVVQGPQLMGAVRTNDGGLVIYTRQAGQVQQRCVITPSPALAAPHCSLLLESNRTGVRVHGETEDRAYVAWFTDAGLVTVESSQIPRFQVRDCHLRYGLLPSFVGTDICYAAARMTGAKSFCIPSTQWFVGLVDGDNSMLVAAWESDSQTVSLGLTGEAENRQIDSLSIGTEKGGFSLSLVEHAGIWHRETLKEDWLEDYVPIGWERPFPARWMGHFLVTPGGPPSFRTPNMEYSFPLACAKTRIWGTWFEDWNHYPFFFDGPHTVFHFEKSFIPNGDALIYFLEPAAADLLSPVEILERALGPEKARTLLDWGGNRIRKLKYSTPDQFMFDRPVCATTTRLAKIKKEEKATVGVNLATHLFEFIREIRARVDQYGAFFADTQHYLAKERTAHPELRDYLTELETLIVEAQAQSTDIHATPLSSVEKKIDDMKARLREGKGDGFDCGNLDVRGTAGSQDDLCRRYNRLVIRLAQTAAWKCGDSPVKALIAKHLWDQSRLVLREPTRWESRRTLYFFEP